MGQEIEEGRKGVAYFFFAFFCFFTFTGLQTCFFSSAATPHFSHSNFGVSGFFFSFFDLEQSPTGHLISIDFRP